MLSARSTPVQHAATPAAASHDAYYPGFDWLRGVLALSVMLAHDDLIPWSSAGNFAVQVFFALSGWLIGNVLLQTPRRDLPRFYFNRAVRIWVPYYIALALLLGVSLLRDPVSAKWLEFVLYKLTFVYNLFGTPQLATHVAQMPLAGTGNHFWSVNTEEQFYLVAPVLIVLATPALGRSRVTWLLLSVLAWWTQVWPSIVFGVTAAVLASHRPGVFERAAVRVLMLVVGLTAAAGLVVGGSYERLAPFVAICIVLSLAVTGQRQALGSLVGGMSYPLYLNHWIGVFVAHALARPFGLRDSPLAHGVSALFNLGLAVGLYVWIERPLLRGRARWYTPAIGRRATLAAYLMMATGLALGLAYGMLGHRLP